MPYVTLLVHIKHTAPFYSSVILMLSDSSTCSSSMSPPPATRRSSTTVGSAPDKITPFGDKNQSTRAQYWRREHEIEKKSSRAECWALYTRVAALKNDLVLSVGAKFTVGNLKSPPMISVTVQYMRGLRSKTILSCSVLASRTRD